MARAKAPRYLEVEGVPGRHLVVENLGFQPSRDLYARVVQIQGKDTVIVSRGNRRPWYINKPEVDRAGLLRALAEAEQA